MDKREEFENFLYGDDSSSDDGLLSIGDLLEGGGGENRYVLRSSYL